MRKTEEAGGVRYAYSTYNRLELFSNMLSNNAKLNLLLLLLQQHAARQL